MENQPPEFGFNVQRILDCGFAIEETVQDDPENTTIAYGMNLGSNIDESWTQINIRADLINSNTNQIFATGTVLTQFGINNLRAYADQKGEIITWPPNAMQAMFGIAFGHLRAIVAKNLAGSKFSQYIIPLVNPATLFDELHSRMMKIHGDRLGQDKPALQKPTMEEKVLLAKAEKEDTLDELYNNLAIKSTKKAIEKIKAKKSK